MQKKQTLLIVMCVIISAAFLTNCRSTPEVKPALGDYMPVEWKKFTAGLFYSDYKNKYIKLDCSFVMRHQYGVTGYSDREYLIIIVQDVKGDSADSVTVVIPKHAAENALDLKHLDKIRVYGQARETNIKYGSGATGTKLHILADRIENI